MRNEYDRDRARIIHSSSFRRLQGKTQVLGPSEGDFHRTRLTHSMEVAQIGRGIVLKLQEEAEGELRDALAPPELMEAVCLAHDLGHPPFGHGGERALNYSMREHGGFEGNGQTLRILSLLEKHTEGYGLNVTRRTLLGVLKYPAPYSEVVLDHVYPERARHADLNVNGWKPPKCYLNSENDLVRWVLEPFPDRDRGAFVDIIDQPGKHRKTVHSSFDASIMTLADDIAYGSHDLEDVVSLRLVSPGDLAAALRPFEHNVAFLNRPVDDFVKALFETSFTRKRAAGSVINALITAVKVREEDAFEHPLLRYRAYLPEEATEFLAAIGKFLFKHVVNMAEVQTLEFRGQRIVVEMFDALRSDPEKMVPGNFREIYGCDEQQVGWDRIVCDFVAGMTDDYAARVYERLFIPRSGSVFQRM